MTRLDTLSRHLLCEFYGCNRETLNDPTRVEALLRRAAEAADVRVVQSVVHTFSPHGVTGVVVVEESHLSVHTWPESGYAAADLFTCGEGQPEPAREVLAAGLEAERVESMMLRRGAGMPGPSIAVLEHRSDADPDLSQDPV